MIDGHETTMPSIGGIIKALKLVFTSQEIAIFGWLFTVVISISDFLARKTGGLISLTSDFPSDFTWVFFNSNNDWMFTLGEWEV
jgi:hypothetical protein